MDPIKYEDFAKLDLRTAVILAAEAVEKTDKLVKLSVDAGDPEGPRTIVAGIRQDFHPEGLVGEAIVIVANLEPRVMRGIESRGMLLAARSASGILTLVNAKGAGAGTKVG